MMRIDYQPGTPGGWVVLVAGDRALVLRPGGSDLDALFDRVSASASVGEVLEHLAEHGLRAIPPFAYLLRDGDGLRVIVRGSVSVATTGPSPRTLDGRGFSTWGEHAISEATGAVVTLDGGAPHSRMPLVNGAAWVSGFRLSLMDAESPGDAESPAVAESPLASTGPTDAASDPEHESELEDHTVVVPRRASAAAEVPEQIPEQVAEQTTVAPVEEGEPSLEPALETVAAAPDSSGDHDGQTVLSDDVRDAVAAARAQRPAVADAAPAPEAPTAARFAIRMPDGAIESLDETVLIGRSPSVSKLSGGRVPRLIAVGSGDNDISRNHVQVEVQGDTVVVTDLQSRNGTVLALPGTEPRKLRAGESATVVVGALVDLGGGISITIEEAPA